MTSVRVIRLMLLVTCGVGCEAESQLVPSRSPQTVRAETVAHAHSDSGGPVAEADTPAGSIQSDGARRAEQVYRPDDDRPQHDDQVLHRIGIRRHESKRLVLYSDGTEDVSGLAALVDAAYESWVDYFGELPPARDGSDYQITGYLIRDLELFRSAGLVPQDIAFEHGRHRGRQFWMRDQAYGYYRSHLVLHEATHCFMTALPGSAPGPPWYMEGMAERFGTHRFDERGGVTFRVMPTSPEAAAGFGRITLVREECGAGRFRTLDDLFAVQPQAHVANAAYAWSWAACAFLDSHPRYRDRFRELGEPRARWVLDREFRDRFAADREEMDVEWALFAHSLRYGFDVEHSAVAFRPGSDVGPGQSGTTSVASDRGWQSSGVRVKGGRKYGITAAGRFTVDDDPTPWESTPAGITFDYFDGRPLGMLLGAVLCDSSDGEPARGLLSPFEVGDGTTITAPVDGVLFFRVNDRWDGLSDNGGAVEVIVSYVAP